MRCSPRLLIEWLFDAFDSIGREDEPGRPMFMFTHVVEMCDEKERVKTEGTMEVLELFLAGNEYHMEEDIFVTMMSYGVVLVALVLFWVRLLDVVYD